MTWNTFSRRPIGAKRRSRRRTCPCGRNTRDWAASRKTGRVWGHQRPSPARRCQLASVQLPCSAALMLRVASTSRPMRTSTPTTPSSRTNNLLWRYTTPVFLT